MIYDMIYDTMIYDMM